MNQQNLLQLILRTLPKLEFEGGTTVTAGIELSAIKKGAGVMHCNKHLDSDFQIPLITEPIRQSLYLLNIGLCYLQNICASN